RRRSMTAHGLTLRQVRLLAFIRDYTQKNGYSPGVREMQAELGLQSKSGVVRLLDALQERGRISRIRGKVRSVVVLDRDTFTISPPAALGAAIRAEAFARGVSSEQIIVSILSERLPDVSSFTGN